MPIRLAPMVLLAALLAPSDAATTDRARAFLLTAFGLTSADLGRLDRGEVVSRSYEVTNRREVATLGIVRIHTSPRVYVDRLSDIATFKRTEEVLQIGTFGRVPQFSDMASLVIEDADLKQLRRCRVDDCDVRLSAEGIERVRKGIDWQGADASSQASRLFRQILVEYVARYGEEGAAAAMEYADGVPRLHVGREFSSLMDADPITAAYAPRLRRHLLDYPRSSVEEVSDFVYWSQELVRGRPVISITHVATAAAIDDAPVAYAIGSKQIYATHYFDASLGLTLLIPDRTAATPTTYVVYVNRSRIDLFEGVFGGVARRIVSGRARSVVADQMHRLQRAFQKNQ